MATPNTWSSRRHSRVFELFSSQSLCTDADQNDFDIHMFSGHLMMSFHHCSAAAYVVEKTHALVTSSTGMVSILASKVVNEPGTTGTYRRIIQTMTCIIFLATVFTQTQLNKQEQLPFSMLSVPYRLPYMH